MGSFLLSFTPKFLFLVRFLLENSPMLAFCSHLLPRFIQVLLQGVMSDCVFCVPDTFSPLL